VLEVVVFVEAEADFRTVTTLIDRVLAEARPADVPDALRRWCGLDASRPFVRWTDVAAAWPAGRPLHGGGAGSEHLAARKALLLAGAPARAVVLVRDADRLGRRPAFERARRERPDLIAVVGVPEPEREAWHLAGFVPGTPDEAKRLRVLQVELGADPTAASHALGRGGRKTARRVLEALARDPRREARCVAETPLARLREAGALNGLAAFLDDVAAHLASRI
jgi:hypothetical protein